ncbi:coiled-coil domain-containing protein 63 [Nasonia vitripennis]|uniref:ODAD1 central coiled coil region domain-containing protein n=1 Tax=Nasonia vitripennis TaxID=7425 RepID=A0A7M7HDY9_NASVI|nr:coiled-coil domain-containing protein 63 [Nasonia vitripennis]XP_008217074.1 coiled-coil domain-containing protein 63 [Nasonia vitripennis]XP_008217075.1 coiled-coil domain-containing protein 63 [Nasonia vitripennis]XP_008217076.1 coiled-coil domain-containing protein 63 [Nasonia vitripennis]XP_008217077.1 coiled-coil domain-containing protein 63 [Nasonia vitripennis]XP_016844953.1 coiled-coil domain-containing protein 63 [Nasonia vitripennis]
MMNRQQPTQDEMELETMAESELSRLKRQYRIMENDRVAYAEEARNQLRNQKGLVEKLEKEKAELVLAIKAAKSTGNAKRDELLTGRMGELLERRSEFAEQIHKERQQIAELQEQIIKLSKEVGSLKLKVRTDNQLKETTSKQERLVFILENRLEVATKRFNVLVADNAKLRGEIDDLLKERSQFNLLWMRLNGQLNTGKQVINDLIEQATITFNQRDEELNKINALKERGMRDLKNHTSEMCELQRTIDNEMKLQEFLGVKGQYREMSDLNAKKEAEKKAKREEMRNKIAVYNQILTLVKQFTGEEEIDKLTAQFLKQEEENFALFSYVNELNDELEGLQTRVAQLRSAIDEARALNVHRGRQQAETLETIARDLKEQTDRADAAEHKLTECNNVINKLLVGVESLFQTIRCDNSPILELLGEQSQVSLNNVMLYLGIVEKRLSDMLNKLHWIDRAQRSTELRTDEDRKPKLRVPALSSIAPTQPCALCVEKEEMQNVSEGLEAPLTLDEVKEKLKTRLQQDHAQLLHNVSGCHLPASRKIIQKRYQ